MRQLFFLTLFFVVGSLFAFLSLPSPAYAANADECTPAGGRCKSPVSGPFGTTTCNSAETPRRQLSCPLTNQTCCMRPADTCEGQGGGCRPTIFGVSACRNQQGGHEIFPNTCNIGTEVCCKKYDCFEAGGECRRDSQFGNGVSCAIGEDASVLSCPSTFPICCLPPGVAPPPGTPPAPPRYTLSGRVFIDTDRDSFKDTGESYYSGGANVRITGPFSTNRTDTTDSGGLYSFPNLRVGTYTVRLTGYGSGYRNTGVTSRSVRVNSNQSNINFGIAPIYTISGNIFKDFGPAGEGNGLKDSGETNFTDGGITMGIRGGPSTGVISVNQGAGTYVISNLFAGTYIVSYASPPTNYQMSAPVNGPPPSFSVTVGTSCSVAISNQTGASCSGSNIINLNFALRQYPAWVQTYGFDVRFDDGYTNIIPAAPAYPPYASVTDR